ncbi:MAG: AAA family ATPase, partial [Mixta sp.]
IFRSKQQRESFEKILTAIDFTSEVYLLPHGYTIINNELHSDKEIHNISLLKEDNIAYIKNIKDYTLALEKKFNRDPLIFSALSSGEQHILMLFIRILSNIHSDCYILIDEPELSLHVKWQQLLPQLFTQLSEDFGAKIVVATHSPVLLASVKHSNSVCYQASPGKLTLISQYDLRNMEAALVDAFDLVTSNNRSIYEHCATAVANFMEKVNQVDVKGMAEEKTEALKTLEGLRAKLNNNLVKVDSLDSDLKLIDRAGIAIEEMYAACLSEAADE